MCVVCTMSGTGECCGTHLRNASHFDCVRWLFSDKKKINNENCWGISRDIEINRILFWTTDIIDTRIHNNLKDFYHLAKQSPLVSTLKFSITYGTESNLTVSRFGRKIDVKFFKFTFFAFRMFRMSDAEHLLNHSVLKIEIHSIGAFNIDSL